MMQIIVRHRGFLNSVAGCAEDTIDVVGRATLVDALRQIASNHPAVGDLLFLRGGDVAPYVKVLLNGERYPGAPAQVRLKSGDSIDLFPMLSGG